MLYRGPNAHLVSRALLKLESYLTMQINKSCESASRLKGKKKTASFLLPLDIMALKLICYFNYSV